MHALYVDDDMTIREIARHTRRSYGTIHNLLVEHGTKLRPLGHQMGTPMSKPTDADGVVIEERKTNGKWGPI